MNNRIAILIPYFGKWPEFMDLYLESCKRNTLVDILFVTDIPPIQDAPANVKFVPMSFEQLKERINACFGIQIPQIRPYKLCDYRPAYGLIFEKEIADYGFWGYGDNDLIYGDLNRFLTREVLESSDIIAFRKDHLHGPFTIYRNTEKVNHLFEKSEFVNDIFLNAEYLSFDEFGRHAFHTSDAGLESFKNDNISVLALKEAAKGNLKLHMKAHSKEVIYLTGEIVVYDNGNVYNQQTKEQYTFYHWVLEKRAVWFKYPEWPEVPAKYYVSETGFYTEKQFRNYKLIHSLRKSKGMIYWLYLKGTNYIKRRTGGKVTLDTYPQKGFVKSL